MYSPLWIEMRVEVGWLTPHADFANMNFGRGEWMITMAEFELELAEALSEREIEVLRLIAEGLSNREIADRLVISVNTVRWYNKQIYSKLDVGSRTLAVARAQKLGLFDDAHESEPAAATSEANIHLPVQLTSFIGRERQLQEISDLLANNRLLTLTGPGGTGKTRLAIRTAESCHSYFADGIYFVDLARINTPTLVEKAIATALGILENPDQPLLDTLRRVLANRKLLLVIDNFEHVIEGAEVVSDLLVAAPRIKVLATSREPLRLSGEQEYPVPPLSLAENPDSIAQSEAAALFVQRAKMVRPSFGMDATNAATIMEICLRLDGLPLAIELAAARCKLLTPQAILSRLDSRLSALTGGSRDAPARQQTLRDTIAWSYNLLDDDEKLLFARLAVFRGGRSLEAIEAVCGDGLAQDVVEILASLLDKSMIRQIEDRNGEPRFMMLETVHEYALERLEASGEAEKLRLRHTLYFVELAERASPELRLARQGYWFLLFEDERDNMRAMLDWSLSSQHRSLGIRLLGATYLYWYAYGYHVEGYRWTMQFMPHLEDAAPAEQSLFLIGFGHMAMLHNLAEAETCFRRALAIARAIDEPHLTAWALIFIGYAIQKRDNQQAFATAGEGLALFQAIDNKPGIVQALNIIGEIARVGGDDDRAMQAYEECLAVAHQTGETRRIFLILANMAIVAQHRGEYENAIGLLQQSLRLGRELKMDFEVAINLAFVASSANSMNQPEKAARLLGASRAVQDMLGGFQHATDQAEVEQIGAAVRARLEPAAFEKAWDEGRRLSLDEAVAYALDEAEFDFPPQ